MKVSLANCHVVTSIAIALCLCIFFSCNSDDRDSSSDGPGEEIWKLVSGPGVPLIIDEDIDGDSFPDIRYQENVYWHIIGRTILKKYYRDENPQHINPDFPEDEFKIVTEGFPETHAVTEVSIEIIDNAGNAHEPGYNCPSGKAIVFYDENGEFHKCMSIEFTETYMVISDNETVRMEFERVQDFSSP